MTVSQSSSVILLVSPTSQAFYNLKRYDHHSFTHACIETASLYSAGRADCLVHPVAGECCSLFQSASHDSALQQLVASQVWDCSNNCSFNR